MMWVHMHTFIHTKSSKKVCLGTIVISEPREQPIIDFNNFLFLVTVPFYLCLHWALKLLLILFIYFFIFQFQLTNNSKSFSGVRTILHLVPCPTP